MDTKVRNIAATVRTHAKWSCQLQHRTRRSQESVWPWSPQCPLPWTLPRCRKTEVWEHWSSWAENWEPKRVRCSQRQRMELNRYKQPRTKMSILSMSDLDQRSIQIHTRILGNTLEMQGSHRTFRKKPQNSPGPEPFLPQKLCCLCWGKGDRELEAKHEADGHKDQCFCADLLSDTWYNQHLAPWNEHSDSIADLWSTSENGFESSKHACPICYPHQTPCDQPLHLSIKRQTSRPAFHQHHRWKLLLPSATMQPARDQNCGMLQNLSIKGKLQLWVALLVGRHPFIDTPPFASAWHLVPCFLPAIQIHNCKTNNHEHK